MRQGGVGWLIPLKRGHADFTFFCQANSTVQYSILFFITWTITDREQIQNIAFYKYLSLSLSLSIWLNQLSREVEATGRSLFLSHISS